MHDHQLAIFKYPCTQMIHQTTASCTQTLVSGVQTMAMAMKKTCLKYHSTKIIIYSNIWPSLSPCTLTSLEVLRMHGMQRGAELRHCVCLVARRMEQEGKQSYRGKRGAQHWKLTHVIVLHLAHLLPLSLSLLKERCFWLRLHAVFQLLLFGRNNFRPEAVTFFTLMLRFRREVGTISFHVWFYKKN